MFVLISRRMLLAEVKESDLGNILLEKVEEYDLNEGLPQTTL